MFLEYTFQWRVVWKHWPELVQAGILTLQITILSIILGLLIAAILAALQDSKNPFARGIAACTQWAEGRVCALARNTPVHCYEVIAGHRADDALEIYGAIESTTQCRMVGIKCISINDRDLLDS